MFDDDILLDLEYKELDDGSEHLPPIFLLNWSVCPCGVVSRNGAKSFKFVEVVLYLP